MKTILMMMILLTGFCYADIIKIDDQTIEETVTDTTTVVTRHDIKRLKLQKANLTAAINKLQADKAAVQVLIDAAKLLDVE